MARKVILALALFALLGLAFAKGGPAPALAPSVSIGNDDNGDGAASMGFAEAGPVGGPVPEGVFENAPADSPETPKKGGASVLEASAIAGVATVAAGFSFFYL